MKRLSKMNHNYLFSRNNGDTIKNKIKRAEKQMMGESQYTHVLQSTMIQTVPN